MEQIFSRENCERIGYYNYSAGRNSTYEGMSSLFALVPVFARKKLLLVELSSPPFVLWVSVALSSVWKEGLL